MKKILCPTDFSEAAQNAVAYAAKLAHATNCELTLLNVQSLIDYSPVALLGGDHRAISQATKQLESQSREVSRVFKVSCTAQVEAGFRRLSSVISERAKNYDLIVMGTDGVSDMYEFFSGSHTYNAIAKSKTPVLVIPSGYLYSEIRSIVYAFDYLHGRNLPLARLVPFVRALNCELTILQVMEEGYSKETEDKLNELQFVLKKYYGEDLHFRFDTIHSSEIASSINSYILRNQPDALALCSIHHNVIEKLFHKSIIRNISSICNYPVYFFHEE